MDSSISNLFASIHQSINVATKQVMEASLSIDKDENLTKNNHNSTIDTYNTHTYYILGQLYERNERREQKKKEESIVWWSYR